PSRARSQQGHGDYYRSSHATPRRHRYLRASAKGGLIVALRRSIGEAKLAFDALSIEGGLLGAEWLGKVAQLEASAQEPADYHVPKGLHIRDEIARSWRIAQA